MTDKNIPNPYLTTDFNDAEEIANRTLLLPDGGVVSFVLTDVRKLTRKLDNRQFFTVNVISPAGNKYVVHVKREFIDRRRVSVEYRAELWQEVKERRLDAFRSDLEYKVKNERIGLAFKMRNLAESLSRDAAMLEAGDETVNSLGVVQMQGSFIDTACAKYMALREALASYDLMSTED